MQPTNQSHFPLTQSQLQLWAGQKLNPEAPLHNTTHSFVIEGAIDEVIFEKSIDVLVNKIDVLRLVFDEKNGIPYQKVLDHVAPKLLKIDATAMSQEEIDRWLHDQTQKQLSLSKKCFDVALLKVRDDEYIWYLNMHHLITDAVSATLVFQYLSDIYGLIRKDQLHDLGPIPSFLTYIEFEQTQHSNSDNTEAQNYWKEKIKTIKELPALYGERTHKKTTKSTRVSLQIGENRSKKIKQLATDTAFKGWTQNLTLFNLLATVYVSFLYRVSGQNIISFGAPMHNRSSKNFKETVGLFIEIFPLTIECSHDDTFRSVFNRIRLETNDYLRYAQSGMVTPEIGSSFNNILNYINVSFSNFDGLEVKSKWMHTDHIDLSHQMRCHIVDFDDTGALELLFDLNHNVFSENLITEVPKHFLTLFDAFLTNIDTPIAQPSLVTDNLRTKPTSSRTTPTPKLILNQFQESVAVNATKMAIEQKRTSYSYQELDEKSNQLANYLSRTNDLKGQNVALFMHRSADYIISLLAVLKTGARFIPIASDQPIERVNFILKDANCLLMLSHSELEKKINKEIPNVLLLDKNREAILKSSKTPKPVNISSEEIAYMLYTSGSTGNPKGVLISHGALANYLTWAKAYYKSESAYVFPLFTSIGFDLTITATFLPLITGGQLIIYKESNIGPDISLMEVLAQNKVNAIKLTPAHLALIKGADMRHSQIKTMIVGGEDFKANLALSIKESFNESLTIYNEYGPTEATVGCIVSKFDKEKHTQSSVPIGSPIDGIEVLLLDRYKNKVPQGVIGEIFITGAGLAKGYANLPDLTSEKFINNPFDTANKMYTTGDLGRLNVAGEFEFLGRKDEQVKLRGFRLELSDIEANLLKHEAVENAAVVLIENEKSVPENEVINCSECGLPSNYPNTDFDVNGVCHVCNAFKGYKDQAQKYFKTEEELRQILISQRGKSPNYDCISLLSGGKDSTYILAQLINMGLRVLAFTLDNGYISEQAKANINRIVSKLKVDHIYGTTEHMNAIFVDSLHRHHNVCNGCFKTIYTLSTQIALDKQIPFVVTGLSRGQFFETRLTEELFWDENVDISSIDDTILEARKLYHQEEDAVKELMDVSIFDNQDTFKKVQFIDFYRYSDVSLEEMLKFLKEKVDWVRPTDTGRSTNCLINQLGIHIHKKEKGYSNYSYPYSWDVRMGHKTRTETLEEINEIIDEKEVKRIALEIGYQESEESELDQKKLVGYYTAKEKISSKALAKHLKQKLPEYMVPDYFKYIEELPLTKNGKVDKHALKYLNSSQLDMETPFVAPNGEIEELLANIWKEVLRLKQVGVHDNFIALGGHSLAAIRVTARINEEIEMKFPLNKIFELPTIASYANFIEQTLMELLNQ